MTKTVSFYVFFSKIDKYKEKFQGKIWLEFSGGPIIDKYFSGSKYVKEIWHSAHTNASQQNITSFFETHGQTYDWTKRLEFASELESGDAKTILNRIMKKSRESFLAMQAYQTVE